MQLAYNFLIQCLGTTIRLAAWVGHSKAKLWIDGRKNTFTDLEKKIQKGKKTYWFHAASLGEFEQGRSLIEKIKIQYPESQIVISFFSPSGYEIRKNYSLADAVVYLPLDTEKNANRFLDLLQPDVAIFIKYEFWYHFLAQTQQRKIPTIYIAAVFRPQQFFFKWYGRFFQPILKSITHFFVQNTTSQLQLQSIGIQQVSSVGDPRVDGVLAIAKNPKHYPIVKAFCNDKKTLIAGSTWQADEILLQKTNINGWKLLIAPHDISESHLQFIEKQGFTKIIRYSKADLTTVSQYEVLLIDNIGMLSSLYQYGDIAYIGGGFGAGIHNTLEPMAHGLPVIFGPKYKKFEEAIAMTKAIPAGAYTIDNQTTIQKTIDFLQVEKNRTAAQKTVLAYLNENQGASEKIMEVIKKMG